MAPRDLLRALAVTLACLLVGNVGIRWLARNSAPRQTMRRLASPPRKAEVMVLGNSVVQAGFNTAVFEKTVEDSGGNETAVNAGMGATGPVQHLLMGRAGLRSENRLRLLVYGGLDFMFTTDTRRPWAWTQQMGNNALVFQTEPEVAARHLEPSALGRAAFRMASHVPMFVERSTPWTHVEFLRRSMGEVGMPKQAVNSFGRVDDFRDLIPANAAKFRSLAAESVQRHDPLSPPVSELLADAATRQVQVVVVLMPVPPNRFSELESAEWQSYVMYLRGLLEVHGAKLVVASDWVGQANHFSDVLHLSESGAVIFSQRLASELTVAGRL